MSEALSLVNELGIVVPDKEEVKNIVSSKGFISRVQFMTSQTEQCKSGTFPVNHFALVENKEFTDLGESVECLALTWRAQALDTGAGVSFFDRNRPEFQEIQERAGVKDSGCMFGPQVLIYVPAINSYSTLFFGSKSARIESTKMLARIGKACLLSKQYIETKKYSWWCIAIKPSTAEIVIPDIEEARLVVDKFQNPPEREMELDEGEPEVER